MTIALHTVKAATGPIPRRSATTAPIPTSTSSSTQVWERVWSWSIHPEYGKPSVSPSAW